MYLSLGERPVRLPVSAAKAPFDANCPSPFCREISTSRAGLRFRWVRGCSIKLLRVLCIFTRLLYKCGNFYFISWNRYCQVCGWGYIRLHQERCNQDTHSCITSCIVKARYFPYGLQLRDNYGLPAAVTLPLE